MDIQSDLIFISIYPLKLFSNKSLFASYTTITLTPKENHHKFYMDRILCVLRANDVHMQKCKAGEGVPW